MNLIDPSLEVVYCSNLISNYSLIRFIRFVSRFTDKLCNAFFISSRFKSHAGAGKKIGILNLETKHGVNALLDAGCWTDTAGRSDRQEYGRL